MKEIRKIFETFKESKGFIKPNFFLTGKTGSGKTYAIQTLCEEYKIELVNVNCASITKEGYSGNSLSKSLTPLLDNQDMLKVVFFDEFDKLFLTQNESFVPSEMTLGVQNEFLKVIEEEATIFGDYGKFLKASTNKCLFIFAGAFNDKEDITISDLEKLGVKREFLGRVPLVFSTNNLTLEDYKNILDNAILLKAYKKLHKLTEEEVKLIKEDIINHIALNLDNKMGARFVNFLLHRKFICGKIEEVKEELEF